MRGYYMRNMTWLENENGSIDFEYDDSDAVQRT